MIKSPKAPAFRLEVGKTYVTRDGKGIAGIGSMDRGMAFGSWIVKPDATFQADDAWLEDGVWAVRPGTKSIREAYDLVSLATKAAGRAVAVKKGNRAKASNRKRS